MSEFSPIPIEFTGSKLPTKAPCKCIMAGSLDLALQICMKQYGWRPLRVYKKSGTMEYWLEIPEQLDRPAFNMDHGQ